MEFTAGCPGCRAVNRNLPAVNRNEECRKRIEDKLREEGHQRILESDDRFKRREEDRDNKRRRMAGEDQGDIARGGVEAETMMDDAGNNGKMGDNGDTGNNGHG